MPQILVLTDSTDTTAPAVVYKERIALSDFESAHFSGQLAERVGWAVSDANRIEAPEEQTAPTPAPTAPA